MEKSKIIITLSLILIILFGMFVGISLSKYESQVRGSAIASIAKPILEIKREQSMIVDVTAINSSASCKFEVSNDKDNEINEVDMEYYLEIVSSENNAIEFKLYKDGQEVMLNNNRTENIELLKDVIDTHKYQLYINYDKTKETSKEDINESIEIKIHSIQKV